MTTPKQTAANKANAKKSTGPKTEAGKAVVAGNAISHGILSSRLFLDDESPDDFQALQDDLRQALRPMGALELALVEKVAVALWKQKRLVAAETATIELGRHIRQDAVRREVKTAMGLNYTDADVTESELVPLNDEDRAQHVFCIEVLEQYEQVEDEVFGGGDLAGLKEQAPTIYKQLMDEAEEDEQTPDAYLKANHKDGLMEWAYELKDWCGVTLKALPRRALVQSIAKMVQAQRSAPIGNEVLMRYQVSLDGELYRAMDQLRKQQEFRLKLGIEVEGEVVS